MEDFNLMFVLVSVIAGLLVGLPAGMAGALVLVARLNASKEAKDTTEELLAKQVPPDTVKEINDTANRALNILDNVFSLFKQGILFVRDVTDGKPNTVPEIPPQEVNIG